MNAIEVVLDNLGKLGMTGANPELSNTENESTHYKVHHDSKLNEYWLVFWYGKALTPNFYVESRYQTNFDDIVFVQGQIGFIFLYQEDLYCNGNKTWISRHYTGEESLYTDCNTDDKLIKYLNNKRQNPEDVVLWESHEKRLRVEVNKLMVALRKIGKQWKAQQLADAQKDHKAHYSAFYNSRSGLHSLALWKGKNGSFPWVIDIYDDDWRDFFKGVHGKHIEVLVAIYGYNKNEITTYVTKREDFASIDEVTTYIQENLDKFFVS
jgi:hypothetical protein